MTSTHFGNNFGEDIDSDDLDENIPIKTTLNTVRNLLIFTSKGNFSTQENSKLTIKTTECSSECFSQESSARYEQK